MNDAIFKERIAKLMSDRLSQNTYDDRDERIIELFQDKISKKYLNENLDLDSVKSKIYNDLSNISPKYHRKFFDESNDYLWGLKPSKLKTDKILENKLLDRMYIIEDTFIRSVMASAQKLSSNNDIYFASCGYTIDDLSHYVDVTRPTRIETVLNSDWSISAEEKKRARLLIDKIISNKITKYNNQPIVQPNIGRKGVNKVLVIDQSYNDYSIIKGNANDKTFESMLSCAIKDNPDADILIKTHPDAVGELSLNQKCYYQNTNSEGNIYKLTDMINPISLINYVDKVYVCSSQFGFEALMCGKDVYTFGMPFYANWGLTNDVQKCNRRCKNRTLEEVFYIAYVMFSIYINPKTNKPCEIEDAIDFLIEYRDIYFNESNEK